jgi:hypothetical protein
MTPEQRDQGRRSRAGFCFFEGFHAPLPWRATESCCSSAIVDPFRRPIVAPLAHIWLGQRPVELMSPTARGRVYVQAIDTTSPRPSKQRLDRRAIRLRLAAGHDDSRREQRYTHGRLDARIAWGCARAGYGRRSRISSWFSLTLIMLRALDGRHYAGLGTH